MMISMGRTEQRKENILNDTDSRLADVIGDVEYTKTGNTGGKAGAG